MSMLFNLWRQEEAICKGKRKLFENAEINGLNIKNKDLTFGLRNSFRISGRVFNLEFEN